MALRILSGRRINPKQLELGAKSLLIPLIPQKQPQWCWAACIQMVLKYFDSSTTIDQCDLSNWLFGVQGCCSLPSASLCNRPCLISDVSRVYGQYSISSTLSNGIISISALQSEINADRPVEIALAWLGGGGHLVLVVGWEPGGTEGPLLKINDPSKGQIISTYYSDLLNAFGFGTWVRTWTELKK